MTRHGYRWFSWSMCGAKGRVWARNSRDAAMQVAGDLRAGELANLGSRILPNALWYCEVSDLSNHIKIAEDAHALPAAE